MLSAQAFRIIILAIIVAGFVLETSAKLLNLNRLKSPLPDEFKDTHDAETYRKSQQYTRTKSTFSLINSTIVFLIQLVFILAGGFGYVDNFARSFGHGEIVTGFIFFGTLYLALKIIGLPFELYDTFVIEARFEFNRTTWKTFLLDELKSLVLTAIIGGLLMFAVMWFFGTFGAGAWVWVWLSIVVVSLLLIYVYPVVLAPLFNKFTPLPDSELKQSIEELADRLHFKRKGLYTMDGSKRSTKSNAYFTGFGRFRRIVLFDTLIERYAVQELLAVLGHEIGHYKLKHILVSMIQSLVVAGFNLWLLSHFLNNKELLGAFYVEHVSVYASLVFFGFLFSPLSTLIGIFSNWLSRKHEYAADAYSAKYTEPQAMITALKRLTKDNLSNLTPHPMVVVLDYDHPPTLERIMALRRLQ